MDTDISKTGREKISHQGDNIFKLWGKWCQMIVLGKWHKWFKWGQLGRCLNNAWWNLSAKHLWFFSKKEREKNLHMEKKSNICDYPTPGPYGSRDYKNKSGTWESSSVMYSIGLRFCLEPEDNGSIHSEFWGFFSVWWIGLKWQWRFRMLGRGVGLYCYMLLCLTMHWIIISQSLDILMSVFPIKSAFDVTCPITDTIYPIIIEGTHCLCFQGF